jgi:hypothetical protein
MGAVAPTLGGGLNRCCVRFAVVAEVAFECGRRCAFGFRVVDLRDWQPPAMRVVQALHWLKDMLPTDDDRIRRTLARLLSDPKHGDSIRNDLKQGFSVLPTWMQSFLRTIPGFDPMPPADPPDPAKAASRRKPSPARSTPAVPR